MQSSGPQPLSVDEVLAFQGALIDHYGGQHGVRDQGLLESALAQPFMGYGDEEFYPSHFHKAAAYLYFLVKNHTFIDGNKRIAFAAAHTYLALCGYRIKAGEDALYDLVISVAEGRADLEQLVTFISECSIAW